MLDTANEIKRTHAIVWQYRTRLQAKWPTPGRIDALRFAFTEAGEAMDAYLRQIPMYARNNNRNMSVPDELADCAMMLCTALPDTYQFRNVQPSPLKPTLDGICFAVADAMLTGDVLDPLAMIAEYLDTNYSAAMAVWVELRLRRIERKVTGAAA